MARVSAIIGGSQGFRFLSSERQSNCIGSVDTPFGRSAAIYRIENRPDHELYYISRHGDEGYTISAPFVNYRANIYALKELGVSRIVAWSGPGAIDPNIRIGEILVPQDIIDETKGRECTFYTGLGIGFIRQNPVFCPSLSSRLRERITDITGVCRTNDVYVCTQGPRLETAAEIRKFAIYGATLVGMTLVPEAFLAKELEMCYCPVCYVTNYAEGVAKRDYKPGELFEGLSSHEEKSCVEEAVKLLPRIAQDVLLEPEPASECFCQRSMERYKLRGDIGDDWRDWVYKPL